MERSEAPVAAEQEVAISNAEGLHFRPIMQFVDTASRFAARVSVHCNNRRADGRSPMELLMLVATRGSRLKVVTEGADAQPALDALVRLVESGFDET